MSSALAFVFRVEAEMDKRVMPLAGFHHNVAAAAAVAAGRAATRDKLLPAKGHASVATVTGLNPNDCFINKHAVYIDCTGHSEDSPQGEACQGTQQSELLTKSFYLAVLLVRLRQ